MKQTNQVMRYVFPGLAVIFAAVVSAAGAAEMPEQDAVAFAAARADAYRNLSIFVDNIRFSQAATLGQMAASDPRIREGLNFALRSAYVVEGPVFSDEGIAHVVVEMDSNMIPYSLRNRLRGFPRHIRMDGVADRAAEAALARRNPGGVTDQVKAWAETNIEAEGTATIQASSNPDQAKDIARLEATANAYASLAEKASQLLLDEDLPIQDFLKEHEALVSDLSATLMRARLVSESVDPDGTVYTVNISLPAKTLLQPLRMGSYKERNEKVLSPEQVTLARQNALLDAQALLK